MATPRKICVMETGYLTSGQCYIQMAIKVKNPSLIDIYAKKFFAVCTPFNMNAYHENMTLKLESKENQLIKMPEEITSLDSAIKWSLENAHPNPTNHLATLCGNSQIMVYNVNHAFCDGSMFKQIFEELQNPNCTQPKLNLPLTFFTTYLDKIKSTEPHVLSPKNPKFTHFKPLKDENSNYSDENLEMVFSETNVENIFNYNNGHVHQLTALLCAAMMLAAKALSDYDDGFGVQAAIDVRRYMDDSIKKSWDLNFHAGNIGIDCDNPKTIKDLIDGLDKKLKYEIDNEEWLNHTHYLLLPLISPGDKRYTNFKDYGLGLYITQMGMFKSNGDITDVMINVNQENNVDCIVLQSYSFISDNKNILKNHIIFRRTGITFNIARKYLNLIDYCLKNFNPDLGIKDFINILKKQIV